MGVHFMGVPLTLEAVVVAIAEASHHMFLMLLFLIVMSKCINDVNDNEYDDYDGDDDDDDDDKDVKWMMMIMNLYDEVWWYYLLHELHFCFNSWWL